MLVRTLVTVRLLQLEMSATTLSCGEFSGTMLYNLQ
jgi:hypothetical protein